MEGDEKLDESQIALSPNIGVSTLEAVLSGAVQGSKELKHLLKYEVDLILECKMCRAMFRSLPLFLAHKRRYCRDLSHQKITYLPHLESIAAEKDVMIVQPESPAGSEEGGAEDAEERDDGATELQVAKEEERRATRRKAAQPERAVLDHVIKEVGDGTFQGESGEYKFYTDVVTDLVLEQQARQQEPPKVFKLSPILSMSGKIRTRAAKLQQLEEESDRGSSPASSICLKESEEPLVHVEPVSATKNPRHNLRQRVQGSAFSSAMTPTYQKLLERQDCDAQKLRCLKCNMGFRNPKTLFQHMLTQHSSTKTFYRCLFCKKSFTKLCSVGRHLMSVHSKRKDQWPRLREKIKNRAVQLSKQLSSKAEKKVEEELDEGCDITPPLTPQKMKSPLRSPFRSMFTSGFTLHSCETCGRAFGQKEVYYRHVSMCKKQEASGEEESSEDGDENGEKSEGEDTPNKKSQVGVALTRQRRVIKVKRPFDYEKAAEGKADPPPSKRRRFEKPKGADKSESPWAKDSGKLSEKKRVSSRKDSGQSEKGKGNEKPLTRASKPFEVNYKKTVRGRDKETGRHLRTRNSDKSQEKDRSRSSERVEGLSQGEFKEAKRKKSKKNKKDKKKDRHRDSERETESGRSPRKKDKSKHKHENDPSQSWEQKDGSRRDRTRTENSETKDSRDDSTDPMSGSGESSVAVSPVKFPSDTMLRSSPRKQDSNTPSLSPAGKKSTKHKRSSGSPEKFLNMELEEIMIMKMIDEENKCCRKCDRRFGSMSNLRRHVVRHYGWKRFKCKLCDLMTFNMSEMRTHLRRAHNRDVTDGDPAMVTELVHDESASLPISEPIRRSHVQLKSQQPETLSTRSGVYPKPTSPPSDHGDTSAAQGDPSDKAEEDIKPDILVETVKSEVTMDNLDDESTWHTVEYQRVPKPRKVDKNLYQSVVRFPAERKGGSYIPNILRRKGNTGSPVKGQGDGVYTSDLPPALPASGYAASLKNVSVASSGGITSTAGSSGLTDSSRRLQTSVLSPTSVPVSLQSIDTTEGKFSIRLEPTNVPIDPFAKLVTSQPSSLQSRVKLNLPSYARVIRLEKDTPPPPPPTQVLFTAADPRKNDMWNKTGLGLVVPVKSARDGQPSYLVVQKTHNHVPMTVATGLARASLRSKYANAANAAAATTAVSVSGTGVKLSTTTSMLQNTQPIVALEKLKPSDLEDSLKSKAMPEVRSDDMVSGMKRDEVMSTPPGNSKPDMLDCLEEPSSLDS